MQALAELAVAVAVQPRKVVGVGEIVARLAGRQMVAMVVRAAAPIDGRMLAEIIVAGGRAARSAPFRARIGEIDALRRFAAALQLATARRWLVLLECGGLVQDLFAVGGAAAAAPAQVANDERGNDVTTLLGRAHVWSIAFEERVANDWTNNVAFRRICMALNIYQSLCDTVKYSHAPVSQMCLEIMWSQFRK